MAKPRNKAIDLLQYVGLRTAAMLICSFSVNANLQAARSLGNFMYRFDRKHRDRAMENLRHAYPDMPEVKRALLARRSMQHLMMLAVETLFTTRLVHLETWAGYCELENFREVLGLLLKRNQNVILLTGHYGNWEILGYVLGTLGFDTTSIARPLDNPYVNRWLLGVREKKGQRILAKKGATEEVTQVLGGGGAVSFIADQDAGRKGIFVNFFGRPACTYKSIGLLAMEYQAPVVVGFRATSWRRVQIRCERAGDYSSGAMAGAGGSAALYHATIYGGNRDVCAKRSRAIFVGASKVEDTAERRSRFNRAE